MKYKFFYGLWGCNSDGYLHSPSGKYEIKLPTNLAFKIHTLLNKFAWTGMLNDIMVIGIMPCYQLYYNPTTKHCGYYRMEYLVIFNKNIKKLYDAHKSHYIKLKKIKCELRLKF